jgi:hypothetical protein
VRTIRPDPLFVNTPDVMRVLDDGRMVLARDDDPRGSGFTLRHRVVLLHAADGTETDTIARLPNGSWGQTVDDPQSIWLFPLFESFALATARGARIVMGHASETELRVQRAEPGLPLDRIVRWTAGNREITPADIAAERERLSRPYAPMNAEMRARFLDPLITERRPVADRFPAAGQLRIGGDGRIWMREYPRPLDTLAHHWVAFAADGRFDCRLDTPRFSEVTEFGADYVLVVDRDSLGVERVKQFAITHP